MKGIKDVEHVLFNLFRTWQVWSIIEGPIHKMLIESENSYSDTVHLLQSACVLRVKSELDRELRG